MPAILTKVSPSTQPVAVWGFKNPVNALEVKAAVNTLSASLTGAGHRFIIMTGTHGICEAPGLVGSQEIMFAEQDLNLLKRVKTKDGQPISIQIWPINPNEGKPGTLQDVAALTAFLNQSLKKVVESVVEQGIQAKTLVLLAYCCSAGE